MERHRGILRGGRQKVHGLGLVVAVAGGLIVTNGVISTPALAASGQVTGTVFQDVNFNGVRDGASGNIAAEPPLAGVQVTATDASGSVVGTATTAANGTYTLVVTNAATADVRIQFALPTDFNDGALGADSGSTVQFVTVPGTADLALTQLGSFNADADPYVFMPSQRTPATMTGPAENFPGLPALFGYEYGATGREDDPNTPATPAGTPTTLATQAQIGNTWGTATYRTNWALSAAFFRRAAPLGPGDPSNPDPANRTGQIYLTNVATAVAGTPNGVPFVTIPNTGASPRANEDVGFDWFHDPASFIDTYRIGLGDIDMSADNKTLYAVNLNDRQLYAVPMTSGATTDAAPVAGKPVAIALPLDLPGAAQGCAADDVRPFGLGEHLGVLYVTLTCTAESTQVRSNLRGYVYTMNESTRAFSAAPVIETSLDYNRGNGYIYEASDSDWLPWSNDFNATLNPDGSQSQHGAQPMLSTITFDLNGDASLSIKDRNGDQGGYNLGTPLDLNSTTLYVAYSAGELLRFCVAPGSYVRETNASCGTKVGSQVNGGFGPGNGLFYRSTFTHNGTQWHDQTLLGSAIQVPGFTTVMATATAPQTPNNAGGTPYLQGFNQQGARSLSNTNGDVVNWVMTDAVDDPENNLSNNGSFAKAGALGDLSTLLAEAPVEIGNRVWIDTDRDGVQDAGEPAVAGVTVTLYAADGTTKLGTAVTDVAGEYSFSNRTDAGDEAHVRLAAAAFTANANYVIKLDNLANYTGAGPLAGYKPTVTAAGPDRAVDSNGVSTPVGSVITAVATAHSPLVGVADHTFDFGFVQQHYDLMITKSLVTSGPYNPGSAVTYSLVVKNNGPDIARSGFTVTDKLPAGLTFGSPAATGTNWTCGAASGQEVQCTWNGSDLADQAAALPITINATVDAGVADGAVFVNYSVVEPSPNQGYPEDIPVGTNPDRYENGSNVPSQQFPSNNDDSKPITVTVIPETTTTTTPPETTTTTTPPVTTTPPDTTPPPVTTVPGTTLPPGGTTIPPQVQPPEAPGELPVTGGNTNGVTLLALGLLLLGLVGFVVSRRRRA
jgi:uncharacterized repeat protein (TIGR01451 family)/LPXTG-motif cell wall-anchored protein